MELLVVFWKRHSHLQGVDQQQFRENDAAALKVNRLPAIVIKVVQAQHGWVSQPGDLRQGPLEVRKERGIVERPLGRLVQVPFPQRKATGDGQPVAVDFEVGGFTSPGQLGFISVTCMRRIAGRWRGVMRYLLRRKQENLEGCGY